MRDIKLIEISDRLASEFHIPKLIMRRLVYNLFKRMFSVMKTNKHRISMRESEVLHIYANKDPMDHCREFADGKPGIDSVQMFRKKHGPLPQRIFKFAQRLNMKNHSINA